MQVTGKIKLINETQTFGSGFTKRDFVVTTDEQYPQHILIELVKDKVDILDKFSVGQDVIVSINLRGREWVNPEGKAKYFNSIVGWRIEAGSSTGETAGSFDRQTEEEDSLPF